MFILLITLIWLKSEESLINKKMMLSINYQFFTLLITLIWKKEWKGNEIMVIVVQHGLCSKRV